MNIIKILTPVVVILITFVQYLLDHKYSNRRSRQYRKMRILFLVFIIVALVFSSISIYLDDISSNELKDQIDSLQQDYKQSDSLANLREDDAKLERNYLNNQIEELSTQLTPFLELAVTKYPNLRSDEALNELQNEIKDIRKQTSVLQEKTDYIENRNIYKPLEKSLKNNLIHSLKRIINIYPDIHLIIDVENGNPLRQIIAGEIKEILNQSGIANVEINPITTFFMGTPPNCYIEARKVDENVAKIFFKPFIDNFFVTKPTGKFGDNLDKNTFILHIVGNPFFEKNGKVNF